MQFELKLKGGKTAIWDGSDGVAASHAYADTHPGVTVVAYRNYPRYGIFVEGAASLRSIGARMIEPGHPQWGKRR